MPKNFRGVCFDEHRSHTYDIILHMCGRPRIYKTEKERFLAKAETSRDAHRIARHCAWREGHACPARTSSNPPPTLEKLREAFLCRNDSCENMIRLGSMLEDIEAAFCVGYRFEVHGDRRTEDGYFFDDDAPWQTGVRGFISGDSFLLSKYKTLMRYKKLSADFRAAIELYDPNPASLVLDSTDAEWLVPVRERAKRFLESGQGSFRLLAKTVSRRITSLSHRTTRKA